MVLVLLLPVQVTISGHLIFLTAAMAIPLTAARTTQAPGGTYAYILTGESYVYEHGVTIASMKNIDGVAMDCETILAFPEKIGFDATIIDQDEGRHHSPSENDLAER